MARRVVRLADIGCGLGSGLRYKPEQPLPSQITHFLAPPDWGLRPPGPARRIPADLATGAIPDPGMGTRIGFAPWLGFVQRRALIRPRGLGAWGECIVCSPTAFAGFAGGARLHTALVVAWRTTRIHGLRYASAGRRRFGLGRLPRHWLSGHRRAHSDRTNREEDTQEAVTKLRPHRHSASISGTDSSLYLVIGFCGNRQPHGRVKRQP